MSYSYGDYSVILGAIEKIGQVYGDRSYESIDKLASSGELHKIIKMKGADETLKNIINDFIDIADSSKYIRYPYRRKLELYTHNSLIICFNRYGYELSSFLGNVDAFISFPLFFKIACEYFNIEKYASKSLEEIDQFLSEKVDVSHNINTTVRVGREDKARVIINREANEQTVGEFEIMPVPHRREFGDLYDAYDKGKEFDPRYSIPIKAEHLTCYYLGKGETTWVAKDCGDGYGYDVINVDKNRKKETLAETKTTHNSENFKLTRVEHKVMLESQGCKDTIYKIFKFNLDSNHKIISLRIYVYDKEKNILVDTLDDSNTCRIIPKIDNSFNKVEFSCVYQKVYKPKKGNN